MIIEVASQFGEIERWAGEVLANQVQLEAAGKHPERAQLAAVPPEIEAWLAHLMHVERRLRQFPALLGALPADTVEGLAALERGRVTFERKHRRCPKCGAWSPNLAYRCRCGFELERK